MAEVRWWPSAAAGAAIVGSTGYEASGSNKSAAKIKSLGEIVENFKPETEHKTEEEKSSAGGKDKRKSETAGQREAGGKARVPRTSTHRSGAPWRSAGERSLELFADREQGQAAETRPPGHDDADECHPGVIASGDHQHEATLLSRGSRS